MKARREFRHIMTAALVTLACMVGIFACPTEAHAVSKATVTKAYRAFKRKNYPNANTKQVDLDKNGINELLVHDGYNYVAAYSYNRSTKKVVKLARVRPGKGYGMSIRYNAKKHIFVLQSASTGGSDSKFYKVSGTKATLKATYRYRNNKRWSNGELTTNPTWYVMGKKVSSGTYANKLNAALKGYGTLMSPAVS